MDKFFQTIQLAAAVLCGGIELEPRARRHGSDGRRGADLIEYLLIAAALVVIILTVFRTQFSNVVERAMRTLRNAVS